MEFDRVRNDEQRKIRVEQIDDVSEFVAYTASYLNSK
jgi:hypothetical protein